MTPVLHIFIQAFVDIPKLIVSGYPQYSMYPFGIGTYKLHILPIIITIVSYAILIINNMLLDSVLNIFMPVYLYISAWY